MLKSRTVVYILTSIELIECANVLIQRPVVCRRNEILSLHMRINCAIVKGCNHFKLIDAHIRR